MFFMQGDRLCANYNTAQSWTKRENSALANPVRSQIQRGVRQRTRATIFFKMWLELVLRLTAQEVFILVGQNRRDTLYCASWPDARIRLVRNSQLVLIFLIISCPFIRNVFIYYTRTTDSEKMSNPFANHCLCGKQHLHIMWSNAILFS